MNKLIIALASIAAITGCKPAHQTPTDQARHACMSYLKDNIDSIAKYDGWSTSKLKGSTKRMETLKYYSTEPVQGFEVAMSGFTLVNGFGASQRKQATCTGTIKNGEATIRSLVIGEKKIYGTDVFRMDEIMRESRARRAAQKRHEQFATMSWEQRVEAEPSESCKQALAVLTPFKAELDLIGATNVKRALDSLKSRKLITGEQYVTAYRKASLSCK